MFSRLTAYSSCSRGLFVARLAAGPVRAVRRASAYPLGTVAGKGWSGARASHPQETPSPREGRQQGRVLRTSPSHHWLR
jgi:hypothetical protein